MARLRTAAALTADESVVCLAEWPNAMRAEYDAVEHAALSGPTHPSSSIANAFPRTRGDIGEYR